MQGDVALNLYDFVVRRPGRPTEKYGLRAYDEIILAPMCIFEPRVIDFDRKRVAKQSGFQSDVTEEIIEHPSDRVVSNYLEQSVGGTGGNAAFRRKPWRYQRPILYHL